ncbi:MAG: DNA recombination protein RmuC [Pseudomonadota bacterium]
MSLGDILATPAVWFWLIGMLAAGMTLGILIEWLFTQPALRARDVEAAETARSRDAVEAELRAELASRQAIEAEREQLLALVSSELSGKFNELAQSTMQSNSTTFLQLAEQHFDNRQQKADSSLAARQKAIETLVKPIEEALKRSESQISALEKARSEAYGGITQQLTNMQELARSLQQETRNLTTALRRPEVRGQWGEITLRRLVEMAGMVEHCDFAEQSSVRTEDGALLRPDLIVRMPDKRELVVDVKTPLDAYLSAVEATDDDERERFLAQHARKVQERIRELASKAYWSQFEQSPEFVILFIPGDQFLSAALQKLPQLIDDALRQNIILATPTSLVALLKAIAYGWRQQALAENAVIVQRHAVELYDRLATFGEHMNKVGKNLTGSVNAFNQAVGSLERSVLPGARKFKELGVQPKKDLAPLPGIETAARTATPEQSGGSDGET